MDITSWDRHVLVLLLGIIVTTRWHLTTTVVLDYLITRLVIRERALLALFIIFTPVSVFPLGSRARFTLLLLVILIIFITLIAACLMILLILSLAKTCLILLEGLLQSVRV